MLERGSEWGRWDLHIHTPGTAKNDQYRGATLEEKWDGFYQAINNYITTVDDPVHNIVAIGITDYISVDNYFKVINDNRLPNSIQLVIPNVEMRLSLSSHKSLLNIHFLFDPQIAETLEHRFFSRLRINLDINTRSFSAVKEDLISLGKILDSKLDEKEALEKGINNFNPSLDAIINLFEDDVELRDHTLIGVVNGSNDGASGLNDSLEMTRKSLYKLADFIFSANPSDRDYFLGKKRDNPNIIKREYGALKPCLNGLDAHCIERIFCPDKDRFCWIKAAPTFNGLKQVVYEPAQRVYISNNGLDVPWIENNQIIDSVEFKDKHFLPQKIYLNPQLNCIIGGKSTGKSLLLHNIAKAVDEKQVSQKLGQTGLHEALTINDFNVTWNDGAINNLGENSNNHNILYIPQTYLNRLSDEEQEITEIDNIIENALLQNQTIKDAYDKLQREINDIKMHNQEICLNLINIKGQSNSLVEQINEIGASKDIKETIEKLEKKRELLNQSIELSNEELNKYEIIVQQNDDLKRNSEELKEFINKIGDIKPYIENNEFDCQLDELFYGNEENIDIHKEIEFLKKTFKEITAYTSKKWEAALKLVYNSLNEKIQRNNNSQNTVRDKLDVWRKILAKNSSLLQINEKIKQKKKLLKHVGELEQQLDGMQKQYTLLKEKLAGSFDKFRDAHIEYENSLNLRQDMKQSELEFSVKTVFRNDVFSERIADLFDKRNLKANRDIINTDDFNIVDFSKKQREELITRCIEGTTLRTVKSITPEMALREIFSDWYNTTYSVTMENDSISNMSPGKKALVLLKLMISLTNRKFPILIDQPEDDLDNRSIFKELIPFIVDRKRERQFIIVTHNANVVLGGDAEEVIVANQHGISTSNNQNVRFQYLTGAIENDKPINKESHCILESKSIQKHICDILEGGKEAFALRQKKYHL